ncbi:MAG: hypothetical protein OEM38_10285, partial [Gammaproteobacteria bacterium]|nr:hypothetical protein [Gammaproteobacteria bacterium]
MRKNLDPLVDVWYLYLDKRQRFLVVAFDEDAGLVELQHLAGNVEEISLSDWYYLNVEFSEAPEDWTEPVAFDQMDDLIPILSD